MQENKKHNIFIVIFSLLFALLAVPSHFKAYPLLLGFLFVLKQKPKRFDFRLFFTNSLLYWGLLLSLLYSGNQAYGKSFALETQILLLALPLFFALIPDELGKKIIQKKNVFFWVYILSVFAYALSPFRWFFAPYHYDIKKLLFHYPGILNSPDYGLFQIHPVYMAAAVGWGFILGIYLLIQSPQKSGKFPLILIEIYFAIILFHLAKMGALIALFISILFLIYLYKRKIFYYIIPIVITGIALLFLVPNTQKRIKEVLHIENQKVLQKTSSGKHLRIFRASVKVFKKSPFFGYGLGSHKDRLLEEYQLENENDLYEQQLSTHNQYMSFLLIGGIFLLLIYLLMIVYSARLAWQTKNYIMWIFLLFFSLVMLFENYLEREAGVVVFAWFFNYFNYLSFYRKKHK